MFKTFGEFLSAVRSSDYPGHFDQRLHYRTAAGASEASPGDGGFTVPAEFSQQIVERMYLTGALISRCMQMPLKSSSLAFPQLDESSRATGSRFGGAKSYWVNEADALTATKPKFLRSELTAKKLIGLVYLTDELFADSDALGIFATTVFAGEMGFRLEDAILNGDGSGKPLGIMNSAALIQVAKQTGQNSGTIVTGNVTDIWRRTWAPCRRNAVWLCHPDAEAQLMTLATNVGTGGSVTPLYEATDDPERQPFNLMLGRPVIPLEQCPVPGTPGDLVLADFSRYVLGMRETNSAVSFEVRFLTDELAFRLTMRVDGQPIDARPITQFTGPDTASSFVAIAAR